MTPGFPKKRGKRSSARRRRGAFSECAGPQGIKVKVGESSRKLEKEGSRKVEKVRESVNKYEKV